MQAPRNSFLKKNACEIFHDEAISPPFRRVQKFKDRRNRCSHDAMVKSVRLIQITVLLMLLAGVSLAGLNAQTTSPPSSSVSTSAQTAPEAESAGLPASASTVFHIGAFPVTNS